MANLTQIQKRIIGISGTLLVLLVLLGWYFIKHKSNDVLLYVSTVSPQSPTVGDHATLSYGISGQYYDRMPRPTIGQAVYVLVYFQNNKWIANGVVLAQPTKLSDNERFIKGTVSDITEISDPRLGHLHTSITIKYGIEEVPVSEGMKKLLNHGFDEGLFGKVAIDESGNAHLEGFVLGENLNINY